MKDYEGWVMAVARDSYNAYWHLGREAEGSRGHAERIPRDLEAAEQWLLSDKGLAPAGSSSVEGAYPRPPIPGYVESNGETIRGAEEYLIYWLYGHAFSEPHDDDNPVTLFVGYDRAAGIGFAIGLEDPDEDRPLGSVFFRANEIELSGFICEGPQELRKLYETVLSAHRV